MAKAQRHPLEALSEFLPEKTFDDVVHYLQKYHVQLTVSRARQTVLGDYRNAHGNNHHRISINGNLNKYAFLITLLHELAHLLTYEHHRHKVMPHGKEWKKNYGLLLTVFIGKQIFPPDVRQELEAALHNPGASTCAEPGLMRVLKRYDPQLEGLSFIEQLQPGDWFVTRDSKVYQMGQRQRTRYLCTQFKTGKQYLFNGLYEVKKLDIKKPSQEEGEQSAINP